MYSFVKPFLLFTTAALLLATASPALRAQSVDGDLNFANATSSDIVAVNGTVATISNGTLATGPLTFPRVRRTYSGTATQTTAAGVVTTGVFTLKVESDGTLDGTFTFGGVNSAYYGAVARTNLGEKRVNGSGYLQALIPVTVNFTNGDGTISPVTIATPNTSVVKVPLVIDSTSVTGGILNADGSSLLFRGDRVVKTAGN